MTVKPDDRLEGCMAMMAARGLRHLPVLDEGKVVGVISIGDVFKDIIRYLENNVGDLMGHIMRDAPGADRRSAVKPSCSSNAARTIVQKQHQRKIVSIARERNTFVSEEEL